MTTRLPLCTLSAAVLMLALPASSLALGGGADRKCYTHLVRPGQDPTTQTVTQPVNVGLNGGTPGAPFQVNATFSNGRAAGTFSGTFNAQGLGIAQLRNIYPNPTRIGPMKGQKMRLTVKDYGTNQTVSLGTVRLTTLALAVSSRPNNPARARTVRISGTPFRHKKLFGFVTSKNGKHVLRKFKLGRSNGCGYVKRKAVVAPVPTRYGRFRLYVNAGRKLHRKRALRLKFRVYKRYF